jgi:hypothetical protein
VVLTQLGVERDGGVEEKEAVVFDLGTGSSWQMDVASGPVVVALAEASRMGGASTLGNSLYLLTPRPAQSAVWGNHLYSINIKNITQQRRCGHYCCQLPPPPLMDLTAAGNVAKLGCTVGGRSVIIAGHRGSHIEAFV